MQKQGNQYRDEGDLLIRNHMFLIVDQDADARKL